MPWSVALTTPRTSSTTSPRPGASRAPASTLHLLVVSPGAWFHARHGGERRAPLFFDAGATGSHQAELLRTTTRQVRGPKVDHGSIGRSGVKSRKNHPEIPRLLEKAPLSRWLGARLRHADVTGQGYVSPTVAIATSFHPTSLTMALARRHARTAAPCEPHQRTSHHAAALARVRCWEAVARPPSERSHIETAARPPATTPGFPDITAASGTTNEWTPGFAVTSRP